MKRFLIPAALILAVALAGPAAAATISNRMIGINVVLNTDITDGLLADLAAHGAIREVIAQIDVVTLQAKESELEAIRALPYVEAANPDAERLGAPVDTVSAEDFTDGVNTWDLDAVNATDFGEGRTLGYDGSGVYVAVLDTGLLDTWRQYFPEERIAEEFAISFSGGGGEVGEVSTQPNKWEHDTHSHGTHVTSTILGYSLRGTSVNGMAPMATVIPVKVLHNAGFGWSSMVARGIVYVADLKRGPLADYPVVINMSLGGPVLDAAEQAAIDYAIESGVLIVAAAGNEGEQGMGYPGAYAPVISAAASGWIGEWRPGSDGNARNWWIADDVADPTDAAEFYITDFSSRELEGQDLDVAAPGSWVVGPFQLQNGQISYFFLGGTSMASPHVAGIVALMAQKSPSLAQADAESILERTAVRLPAGCRTVATPFGTTETFCWEDDATGSGLALADAALKATGRGR